MPPHSDRLGEDDGMATGVLLVVEGFGVGLRSPLGLIDGGLDATVIGAEIGADVDGLGVRGPSDGVLVGSGRKVGVLLGFRVGVLLGFKLGVLLGSKLEVLLGSWRKLGDADGEGVGKTVEGFTNVGMSVEGLTSVGVTVDGLTDVGVTVDGLTEEGLIKDGLIDVTGAEGPKVGEAIMVG